MKSVLESYLQSGKLRDPGHNLVVRVNNLRPNPEEMCMVSLTTREVHIQ